MNPLLSSFLSVFGTDATIKACLSALCVILLTLFGENWMAYIAVIVLVSLDTITGFLAARYEGKVSSHEFFKGWSKIAVFIILLLGFHQLVRIEPTLAILDGYIALWMAVNEVISITENAARMGIKLPSFLTKGLAVLREKAEKK